MQEKVAKMAAYVYAMDAMLYMTTGIVDRHDTDIMLETAICKVFCSEIGFRTVDNALQVMGGEGYMTENVVERLWRDSRINIIVEGANEVMHSFVFAYGSKQLGEYMLGVKANPFKHLGAAMQIAAEILPPVPWLRIKRPAPRLTRLHPKLAEHQREVERQIQDFSHHVKLMFKEHEEKLITRQMIQARLSLWVIWLHAMICSLSKLDQSIRRGHNGQELADEIKIVNHVCSLCLAEIAEAKRGLFDNPDATIAGANDAAWRASDARPHSDFFIPESTSDLDVRGKGRAIDEVNIPQFGSGSTVSAADVPH